MVVGIGFHAVKCSESVRGLKFINLCSCDCDCVCMRFESDESDVEFYGMHL